MIELIGQESKQIDYIKNPQDPSTLKDLIKFLFLYTRMTFDFGEDQEGQDTQLTLDYYIDQNKSNKSTINLLYHLV